MSNLTKIVAFALALAVLGAGSATAAKLITGKSVQNRSLTGKDIKKGSLSKAVLAPGVRAALESGGGGTGPTGPTGPAGPAGPAGPTGSAGPVKVFIDREAAATISNADTRVVGTQELDAGTYSVMAPMNVTGTVGGKSQTCVLRYGNADFATQTWAAGDGERYAITLAGPVTIPADAPDKQIKVVCTLEDDKGEVQNLSIVSTRADTITTVGP